jgi:uncharacterized protein (TIGR02466 family)
MELENLFPTPVAFFRFERDLSEIEMDFIINQKTKPNIGNLTSENKFILRDNKMLEINDFIERSISEYFVRIYSPRHQAKLRVTQSWCNYTKKGQYHHKHDHSNSLVSGVFYPFADKNTDRISFYREGFRQLKFSPTEWNIYNSESWWFSAGTGDLVLFPSSMPHMVEEVKGDHTRISLSFNTFPAGLIGNDEDLTGLVLDGM